MIRHEYISVQDYRKVGLENEYWLWHFTPSKPLPNQQIQSIKGQTDEIGFHPFRYVVERIGIPVFETPAEKAVDFLISLDPNIVARNVYQKDHFFTIILGFNHMRLVSSTHHPGMCLCAEGIINIVAQMNPKILENFFVD